MTPTASLKTTLSNSGTICLGLKDPKDPPINGRKERKSYTLDLEELKYHNRGEKVCWDGAIQ